MTAERSILAVKYTQVSAAGGLRRVVGGFLRYIHYRDQHEESADLSGHLKYVAYRDRSGPIRGRVFGPSGPAGDEERRRLVRFVVAASDASQPQPYRDRQGQMRDRRRAVYRFVLSPEFAAGLDLQALTRATMAQLQVDAEGGAGLRWLAAEHRNTGHPHVHVVLAGFREMAPGEYRSLILTKPRLASMKVAAADELQRQRSLRPAPAAGRKANWPRAEARTLGRGLLAPPLCRFPKSPAPALHARPRQVGPRLRQFRLMALRYRGQLESAAAEERRRQEHGGRTR